MTRLQAHKWIQEQLGPERAAAVMRIADEDQTFADVEEAQPTFGPYAVSPLNGLHFDNAADTVAS